jgi:hypothetical protein
MIDYLSCPKHLLFLSTQLLLAGLALLLVGVVVAYGLDGRLAIGPQVAAHAAVILGPSLLKIGYVMRLLAQHLMRKAGWERCCASA